MLSDISLTFNTLKLFNHLDIQRTKIKNQKRTKIFEFNFSIKIKHKKCLKKTKYEIFEIWLNNFLYIIKYWQKICLKKI